MIAFMEEMNSSKEDDPISLPGCIVLKVICSYLKSLTYNTL